MQRQQSGNKKRLLINLIITLLALSSSIAILVTTIVKQISGITLASISVSKCPPSYQSTKYADIGTQLLIVFAFNVLSIIGAAVIGVVLIAFHMKARQVDLKALCLIYMMKVTHILASIIVFGKIASFQMQFHNFVNCAIVYDGNILIILISAASIMLFTSILQFVSLILEINTYFKKKPVEKYIQSAQQQRVLSQRLQYEQTLNSLRIKDQIPLRPALFNQQAMMMPAPQRQKPKQSPFQVKQSRIKFGDKSSDYFSNHRQDQLLEEFAEQKNENLRRHELFLADLSKEKLERSSSKASQYMNYFQFLNNSSQKKQNFQDLQQKVKDKYNL